MNRGCKIGMMLALCYACITSMVYAQTKPILVVLPFTGEGSENDRATIARSLSFELDKTIFDVVSRGTLNAIMNEQQFQHITGLTDSDTISGLGRLLNADFVMAGHIQTLGNSNLVLITIINVKSLQQIAGDYREYKSIEEVLALLPSMAKRMMDAAKQDTSKKPKLAVLPFNIPEKVDPKDAEVLAQILVTEVANSGKYAVLPRTTTIQRVMKELSIQRTGLTDPTTIKVIGMATNAQYVLTGEVGTLGSSNIVIGEILNIENGSQISGGMERFNTISDGLKLMAELSKKL